MSDRLVQMYYRARYYQPGVGRFASLDSFSGFLEQGQSLNRYAYAHGNAVNLTDPSGFAPSIIETLGGYVNTFIVLLGAIIDGLGTAAPSDINQMGPNARLGLFRGVLRLFGNAVILFGVYNAFQDAFADESLTYPEQVLKFFVSALWNLLAAWLITNIVAGITTFGRGAAAGLIVVLAGFNVLLVIMVNALIDGTFNILRRTLPGVR